jgi:hypothetical protein
LNGGVGVMKKGEHAIPETLLTMSLNYGLPQKRKLSSSSSPLAGRLSSPDESPPSSPSFPSNLTSTEEASKRIEQLWALAHESLKASPQLAQFYLCVFCNLSFRKKKKKKKKA